MTKTKDWSDADVAHGERTAQRVLAELRVKHPTETAIENLAMLRGALVRDLPLSGAQGRSSRIGGNATITVSTAITYGPRRRFVIAHELGHLEVHDHTENQIALCDERQISEIYDRGAEREANAFASEFLMPRQLWAKRADVGRPTLDIVSELATEFEVSFVASAIRFVKLCPERCCAVFSKAGTLEWWAAGSDFGYSLRSNSKLDPYTLASDYFTKGTVNMRPECVSASAWIDSNRISQDDDLVEHARPIPSLGAVLSLLWIPASAAF